MLPMSVVPMATSCQIKDSSSVKFLQVSLSVYKLLSGRKRRLHLIPVKSSEKLFVRNSGKNLDIKIFWHRTGNKGCSLLGRACHKYIFVISILPYKTRQVMLKS